jgi:wyosine [tRNA(Phe)-imidazoG37] synthetase (radical SAM superfamily)
MVDRRAEFFLPKDILAEVSLALDAHKAGDIDWVTFVGSGETTLHASLGQLIQQVKKLTKLPVAVITNGSLLYIPKIRQELLLADAVLPSLDAGTPKIYQQINRPHPIFSYERLLKGLIAFRKQYRGKLWIEVMLVRNLNDSKEALGDIAAALQSIQPDEVHLVQPIRPPAETWVRPSNKEGLLRALAILGDIAKVISTASGSFDLSGSTSLADAVIGIITRHPMREGELMEALERWPSEDISAILFELQRSGQAQIITRYGVRFWSASGAHYPTDE